jgi:multiple sugar transport system permease protein
MLGQKSKASKAIELIVILIIAILFTFPLYWIITGAFKTVKEVNSTTPVWWPYEWTMDNWTKLMGKLKAPLFEINIPFSQYCRQTAIPSWASPVQQFLQQSAG